MTENGAFKKRVRAHAAKHGENYTTARRRLLREQRRPTRTSPTVAVEPHFRFFPPSSIAFVDARGRQLMEPPPNSGSAFAWGYSGDGPLTAADALLIRATGSTDPQLGIGFVEDNLAYWDELADYSFVLTLAEVRAWRRENEGRIQADAARNRTWDSKTLADHVLASFTEPPRRPWWERHRATHGAPQIAPFPKTLIGQALETVRSNGGSCTKPVPISAKQARVLAIHNAARAVRQGHARAATLDEFVESALSHGVAQNEVDAALDVAADQTASN